MKHPLSVVARRAEAVSALPSAHARAFYSDGFQARNLSLQENGSVFPDYRSISFLQRQWEKHGRASRLDRDASPCGYPQRRSVNRYRLCVNSLLTRLECWRPGQQQSATLRLTSSLLSLFDASGVPAIGIPSSSKSFRQLKPARHSGDHATDELSQVIPATSRNSEWLTVACSQHNSAQQPHFTIPDTKRERLLLPALTFAESVEFLFLACIKAVVEGNQLWIFYF